ncbi:MAG: A/G-specific adenine glycosylase [Prevotella sp.]|nr:A/G-specific adenine glycosylase [Prevotella sp.]
MAISGFAQELLRWFRDNGRQMPWRETSDPYAIWLSEVILQQTQVKQGWDYWQRFMQRWPTVEQLAQATEDEVLREWQGLGYYSRARNLLFAARQVVQMGGFPRTLDGLRSLKGVGDYTAAAIASFAFGLPAAVVDGNVYRVLARYFGIATPINTTEGKKEFALLAQDLLPFADTTNKGLPSGGRSEGTSLYNQAIMDFGATQCVPQSPRCTDCPLQETCVAFREGRVGELPVKLKKLKVKERRLDYVYIRCQGFTAIHRRGPGDIWQGLWEPVLSDKGEVISDKLGVTGDKGHLTLLTPHSPVRHVLTHQVLLANFYLLETDSRPPLPADYLWVREADLVHYALPRLIERLLQLLPESDCRPS